MAFFTKVAEPFRLPHAAPAGPTQSAAGIAGSFMVACKIHGACQRLSMGWPLNMATWGVRLEDNDTFHSDLAAEIEQAAVRCHLDAFLCLHILHIRYLFQTACSQHFGGNVGIRRVSDANVTCYVWWKSRAFVTSHIC